MLYSEFILKAKKMTVNQTDNGTWFLEPEWKDMICRNIESNLNNLTDSYLSDWWDLENILRLEVDRLNARDSFKKDVIDWFYGLITTQVEPAILSEETDYIKQVIEFMKQNHAQQKE